MTNKKLDITQREHVDCYKMMTEEHNKGYFYRVECPKCGKIRCQTTGRKVYCRKSINVIEVKCEGCWERFWTPCPDWWC
jgi:ribosomal protein S27E